MKAEEVVDAALAFNLSHDNATKAAIDGAIEYGRKGINPPSSEDHWLMEYWRMGQQAAAAAPAADPVGLFYRAAGGLLHQVDPQVVRNFPNDPGRIPLFAATPLADPEQNKLGSDPA